MDKLFGYGLIAVDESMIEELDELDDIDEIDIPDYQQYHQDQEQ